MANLLKINIYTNSLNDLCQNPVSEMLRKVYNLFTYKTEQIMKK